MLRLVSKFLSHQCMDARDRIFAVEAFAFDSPARIEIDYSEEQMQTHLRFALGCMEGRDGAGLLVAAIERLDVDFLASKQPTWVPDRTRTPQKREASLMRHLSYTEFACSRFLHEPDAVQLDIISMECSKQCEIFKIEVASTFVLDKAPITIEQESFSSILPTMVRMYQESNTASLQTTETLWHFLLNMSICRTNSRALEVDDKTYLSELRQCCLFRCLDSLWTQSEP